MLYGFLAWAISWCLQGVSGSKEVQYHIFIVSLTENSYKGCGVVFRVLAFCICVTIYIYILKAILSAIL